MIEPGLWDMLMRLRSRGISDTRVIEAFERAPRSRFVPDPLRPRAYDEGRLPLPCGQEMLSPLLTAQLLQVAGLGRDTKTLVVGLGSGQVAGLAARISDRVYTIERYAELLAFGEANLARAEIANVTSRWGDGRLGWKANAPFDRILLTGAVKAPPKALIGQLASDGRLAGVIAGQLSAVSHDASVQPFLPADVPPLEPGKSAAL